MYSKHYAKILGVWYEIENRIAPSGDNMDAESRSQYMY